MPSARLLFFAVAIALLLQANIACAQPALAMTGQGQVRLPSDQISELSGITYLGGDDYIVVSDHNSSIATATIQIDRETGQILQAQIGPPIQLDGGGDLEAIVIDPLTRQLIVADESRQTLGYHLPTGQRQGSIPVPAVFARARPNRGLESLSVSPDGGAVWIANEEALQADGERATEEAGTLVRLQRFGPDRLAQAQYAYLTQPHAGADNRLHLGQCGVSGLVALPDGALIVMERELGGRLIPTFRNRLYLVDTAQASDTSTIASLTTRQVQPVGKSLLLQVDAGLTNFEGITLGPRLNNGDYAVVMVSDDGGGQINPQSLLVLRLSGVAITSRGW